MGILICTHDEEFNDKLEETWKKKYKAKKISCEDLLLETLEREDHNIVLLTLEYPKKKNIKELVLLLRTKYPNVTLHILLNKNMTKNIKSFLYHWMVFDHYEIEEVTLKELEKGFVTPKKFKDIRTNFKDIRTNYRTLENIPAKKKRSDQIRRVLEEYTTHSTYEGMLKKTLKLNDKNVQSIVVSYNVSLNKEIHVLSIILPYSNDQYGEKATYQITRKKNGLFDLFYEKKSKEENEELRIEQLDEEYVNLYCRIKQKYHEVMRLKGIFM